MYKRILVATDGSELATRAVNHGLSLAKSLGATVIAIYVMRPLDVYMPAEVMIAIPEEDCQKGVEKIARQSLEKVKQIADGLGVPCETRQVLNVHPWQAIVDAASKENCDLIVMGSHGRTGLVGLVLGSETQKVLAHSNVAVLVHR